MKIGVWSLLALILTFLVVPAASGQVIDGNVWSDFSLRAGVMFGQNMVRPFSSHGDNHQGQGHRHHDHAGFDYDFRLPVLDGQVEVTPAAFLSARLSGTVSRFGNSTAISRALTIHHESTGAVVRDWDVIMGFSGWEAAGLLHLWRSPGYRFSLVGGFKGEYWSNTGDPTGATEASSYLRESMNSEIPFLALQTTMDFGWWRSRSEIIASPFMNTYVEGLIVSGTDMLKYSGRAGKGGMVQFEVSGSANVYGPASLGLFGRWRYQELRGQTHGYDTQHGGADTYELELMENYWMVAANLLYPF